ncbi:MAG: fibronectin type III domain-containing protein [Geobacteraceae bacterium]|nr:fibronectin type III domain-containing protein [Geobacteraceae bacterium]
MKRILFAAALSMVVMVSVSGCGSGSGDGSFLFGGDDAAKRKVTVGSATLAWEAPVNSDGTPMTNVAGYNVHYGTSSGSYRYKVDNGMLTTCTISGLSRGTYYFSVTCYDASGSESSFSNETSKTIY